MCDYINDEEALFYALALVLATLHHTKFIGYGTSVVLATVDIRELSFYSTAIENSHCISQNA